MSDAVKNYWEEAVSSALEESGVKATSEQLSAIASDIAVWHDNYTMAFPVPDGPSQSQLDVQRLEAEVHRLQRQVVCPECRGRGSLTSNGPSHSATSSCWKCDGEGRVDP